jgi:iron complex transport system permease protein
MMPTAQRRLLFLLLALLSVGSVFFAAAIGSVTLSWEQWWSALFDSGSAYGELVWRIRLPRAAAAWTVGALLSLSGCLMQVLLRNPLADPYILGVSGGASFAALFGMSIGVAAALLPALAWAGALLSILIVFGLARGEGPWSGTRLLLTGVVTASGWAALISLLLTLGPDGSLRGMLFWLIGDLSYARLPAWSLVMLLGIFAATLGMARSLNVLAMGETTASLLGEPTRKLLWVVYLLGSVLTHLMRLLVGSDHRILLPSATLFGGLFLVLSDTLARTVLAPRQLPVGVVTALLGVPLFLLLLNRARVKQ